VAVTDKLKWKKLVNQLRYTYDELDLVEEIASSTAAEFQAHYEGFCERNNINLKELNEKHADHLEEVYGTAAEPDEDGDEEKKEETPEEKADREIHEIFSKLFKKIAFILHPDRLSSNDKLSDEEKDDMLETFKSVKDALEERRYFVLLDCAEKYKIPLPKNYKQQSPWMKKELEHTKEAVGSVTNSYNYKFADCDTDDCRDDLIRNFLEQLFELNT
jgi:hypothetical protein